MTHMFGDEVQGERAVDAAGRAGRHGGGGGGGGGGRHGLGGELLAGNTGPVHSELSVADYTPARRESRR